MVGGIPGIASNPVAPTHGRRNPRHHEQPRTNGRVARRSSLVARRQQANKKKTPLHGQRGFWV